MGVIQWKNNLLTLPAVYSRDTPLSAGIGGGFLLSGFHDFFCGTTLDKSVFCVVAERRLVNRETGWLSWGRT